MRAGTTLAVPPATVIVVATDKEMRTTLCRAFDLSARFEVADSVGSIDDVMELLDRVPSDLVTIDLAVRDLAAAAPLQRICVRAPVCRVAFHATGTGSVVEAVADLDNPPSVIIDVPPLLGSAALARRFVSGACVEWGIVSRVDDAMLIAGELVTNAVRHGAPPISLRLRARPGGIRIEVADASATLPAFRAGASDGGDGGLATVGGVATAWGYVPSGDRKTIWAEIAGA
jgi:hypothetical protein